MQEQYRKEIKGEVVDILNNVYGVIQGQQKDTLEAMLAAVKASAESQEKKIKVCTQKCDEAVISVNDSVDRLHKMASWQDMLLWISPIAVVADLVVRLIQHFG